MTKQYFTIHSIQAINNKQYSVVVANIQNTPEKLEKAKTLYDTNNWHYEFHDIKIDTKFTII